MTDEQCAALAAVIEYLETMTLAGLDVDRVDPSLVQAGLRHLKTGVGALWVARVRWLEDRADPSIAIFSSEERAKAWVADLIAANPPKPCGCCGYAHHYVGPAHLDTGEPL